MSINLHDAFIDEEEMLELLYRVVEHPYKEPSKTFDAFLCSSFFAPTSVTHVEERGGLLLPFILERFHCVCCCVWLKSFQHFFYNLQLSHFTEQSSSPLQNAFQSVKGPLRWCLPWRSLFSRNWRMTDVCKIAFFPFYSLPLPLHLNPENLNISVA